MTEKKKAIWKKDNKRRRTIEKLPKEWYVMAKERKQRKKERNILSLREDHEWAIKRLTNDSEWV